MTTVLHSLIATTAPGQRPFGEVGGSQLTLAVPPPSHACRYLNWWALTVTAAFLTAFLEPLMLSFKVGVFQSNESRWFSDQAESYCWYCWIPDPPAQELSNSLNIAMRVSSDKPTTFHPQEYPGLYPYDDLAAFTECSLLFIFAVDLLLCFHRPYVDRKRMQLITDLPLIRRHYWRGVPSTNTCAEDTIGRG